MQGVCVVWGFEEEQRWLEQMFLWFLREMLATVDYAALRMYDKRAWRMIENLIV